MRLALPEFNEAMCLAARFYRHVGMFFCGLKHNSSEIIFTSLICFFIVTSVLMGKKGEHAIENYAHSEKKIIGVSALLFSFTLKFNVLVPATTFHHV